MYLQFCLAFALQKQIIFFSSSFPQDARPEEEYLVSHIDGATRVDYDAADVCDIVAKLSEQEKG
jgi:3-mercaptopyruvate sulfurtransferase SseA